MARSLDPKNDFSIVVPLYNKAGYIDKTIRSVLAQTYPGFEVLIVDDGSTDNSLEIVQSFSDERIRIISQKNSGVSNARNTGIKAAKYDLIALLDGDDWWDERYLEEMMGLIREYPNVSIYSSQFAFFYNGKSYPSVALRKNSAQKTDCFDCLQVGVSLKHLPIHTSSIIFRKDILQQAGLFDERITYFEDHDLFIRISVFSKWAYLEKRPLSFYNLDIPGYQRITGKLPKIENHLLYYIDKFEALYPACAFLQPYMDIFVLNSLYDLRYCRNYKTFKCTKLKNIPWKKFSCKQIVKYYVPACVTDLLRKIHLKIKGHPF